ncbi:MAG TPA: hypothetical protein PKA58_35260 [Polyangium sp.]|nr:hypothetical protein [Polyangium sp.]
MAPSAAQLENAASWLETETMKKSTGALLLIAFAGFGCKKESTGDGAAATSETAIGVAECDAYVEKMNAFLDTLPAESRAAREPGFKAMAASWREAAKAPNGKETLAATCKAQLATIPQNAPAK